MSSKAEIITQPNNSDTSPNIPASSEFTAFQVGLAIIPIAFLITLAFIFYKQVKYRKYLHTKANALKLFSTIPCRKCQFFNNNQQLPCAVQPSLVLSLEAVNCSDYTPKNKSS